MPNIPRRQPSRHSFSRPNPDLLLVALLGGAAIGAILALVFVAVVRPELGPLAQVAIYAIAAVAGGVFGAGSVLAHRAGQHDTIG